MTPNVNTNAYIGDVIDEVNSQEDGDEEKEQDQKGEVAHGWVRSPISNGVSSNIVLRMFEI
ncbi:MAG: hypothetical protein GWO38_03205 [Phycisphaerae bacterium]|nr:hypothetical protein [Phycisphaerae bacterium]NIW43334.1 hypothetical protein [Gammaproteobacteria bacterium]NIX26653.1 hypothetical protein [Phycisphaerae bacterium]